MKKLFITFLFLFVTVAHATVIYPVPESSWDKVKRCHIKVWCYFQEAPISLGGTSVTTIAGTDRLTDSRAVINANFSSLNVNKTEQASTSINAIATLSGLTSASSLATVGTIGSGVWQGTGIAVAYQGTGTTSPTLNQIMFGNAGSGFKVIGFGTSGQFLTSGGSATTPSWTTSALDQTLNYNWTGTTFNVKNLYASSTVANPIVLNTVSYNTPSSQGGNGRNLQNDGSGNLSWSMPLQYSLIGQSDVTAGSGYATSTLLTIPANVMTASSTITVRGFLDCQGGTSYAAIVNGSGTRFVTSNNQVCGGGGAIELFEPFTAIIYPNYSVSSQKTNWNGIAVQTSGTFADTNQIADSAEGTSSFDLSSSFSIGITINSSGSSMVLKNYSIVVNP